MIQFAAPQFAWALAIPAAIVALYLLRRKYVPRQVPSTFLWQAAIRDHAANKPLQRLRKNLLLPVQLLAALMLVLALMQPFRTGGAASRTVMIFDLSAGMQTVSEGRSRLEEAKDRADEILRGLPPGEEITVLAAGEEVRQVLSAGTDREDAHRAIRGLRCGNGGAELNRAVSLAEAIRREDPERGARIIVFSDSYLPPAGISAENAGQGEDNRGVYALTAEEGSAYARICNYGADCVLTVSCEADGALCEAKEISIPAGETAGVLFSLPEGAAMAEVKIREKDALTIDDTARTPVRRSTARTVALTGDNLFLESALQIRPDLRVVRTSEEAPAETEADLYIYGTSPLFFTRDPSGTAFSWTEEKEASGTLSPEDTPMTKGMTLRNVTLRKVRGVTGGKAAIRAGEETVAAYTENEAVIGFSLQDTNLPMKYDFPILIQNILNLLLPETEAAEAGPEEIIPREESDVRTVAPSVENGGNTAAATRGQNLTGIFLAAFLVLLTVEFILAREPWVRGKGKGAKQ